jgi:hypothetical protein
VTCYSTRTAPSIRGIFVLEKILGARPAAPPPYWPALEECSNDG